jgi:acetyl-CoA carboxylase carboxyltransferase component
MTDVENRQRDDTRTRVADLHQVRESAHDELSGRPTEQQHARRKLTAPERLAVLLDEDSFVEVEGLRRHSAAAFGMETRRPAGDGGLMTTGTARDGSAPLLGPTTHRRWSP